MDQKVLTNIKWMERYIRALLKEEFLRGNVNEVDRMMDKINKVKILNLINKIKCGMMVRPSILPVDVWEKLGGMKLSSY